MTNGGHITFCYLAALTVSKKLSGSVNRMFSCEFYMLKEDLIDVKYPCLCFKLKHFKDYYKQI